MLIGYARVSTQETREQSPEKRRRTPLTTFWAAETQLGEPPHCVRSRLRRMQAPQRSSETPRLGTVTEQVIQFTDTCGKIL